MSGLGETFATVVSDGSLVVAFAVAALVGLISFASPCCLPLVPGYLGYIAGLAGSEVQTEEKRRSASSPEPTGADNHADSLPAAAVAVRTAGDPRSGRRHTARSSSSPASVLCSSRSGRCSVVWAASCWNGRRC